MESAMTLLRRIRSDAGLSVRTLAQRADVSASTIARIESGQVDPTYGMLIQILLACGQDLQVTTRRRTARDERPPDSPPRIAALATAWKPTALGESPDWARLRGTLDYLTRHPNAIPGAIRKRPPASGSAVIDTLLAGIAEKLADDIGCPRPAWTQKAPALDQEWAMPGTPQMRQSRRESTPPQLLRRGLVLDRASLWRDQAPSGV